MFAPGTYSPPPGTGDCAGSWGRWARPGALVLAGLAVGCSSSALRCPASMRGLSADEVLASLDQNGDRTFDADDVEPGESVVVFRLAGPSGEGNIVVSRDPASSLLVQEAGDGSLPWGDRSRFGTWHEFTECSADGWITHWFFDEDPEAITPSTGAGELHHLAVDVAEIEHGNIGVEPEVGGVVHLDVSGEGASGFLDGESATAIVSYTTQEPTGQQVQVLGHAFRDLPELNAGP